MNIKLKELTTIKDLAACLKMVLDESKDDYDSAVSELVESIGDRSTGYLLGAFNGSVPVGFVHARAYSIWDEDIPFSEHGDFVSVELVFVPSALRGKGVATTMYERLHKKFAKRTFISTVDVNNPASQRLRESFGGKKIGLIHNHFYEDGHAFVYRSDPPHQLPLRGKKQ